MGRITEEPRGDKYGTALQQVLEGISLLDRMRRELEARGYADDSIRQLRVSAAMLRELDLGCGQFLTPDRTGMTLPELDASVREFVSTLQADAAERCTEFLRQSKLRERALTRTQIRESFPVQTHRAMTWAQRLKRVFGQT
jgi:hypothetical protein